MLSFAFTKTETLPGKEKGSKLLIFLYEKYWKKASLLSG